MAINSSQPARLAFSSTPGITCAVKAAIAAPDFEVWEVITETKDALPDADDFAETEDKLADFSPKKP